MGKHVKIPEGHIEVANRLINEHTHWPKVDAALLHLKQISPGFALESTILKVTVINSLYHTNVFDPVRVAEYFTAVLMPCALKECTPKLVETLAKVPKRESDKKKGRRLSLASKFAHFFVCEKTFPIYDRFARRMVEKYRGLDRKCLDDDYVRFAKEFKALAECHNLTDEPRKLDRFLWLQGQYEEKDKPSAKINTQLKALFKSGEWPPKE